MLDCNYIKNKLLETGCFINNLFLDTYIEFISKNEKNEFISFERHRHHIIPCCVVKRMYKLSSREEALKHMVKHNIDTSCVILDYIDHTIAHYYLCLCAKKEYIPDLYGALILLGGESVTKEKNNIYIDIEKLNTLHDIWRKYHSECPFLPSVREKISRTLREAKRFWITNNSNDKLVTEDEYLKLVNDGYHRGRRNYFKMYGDENKRRQKISKANTGKHLTEETKEKLRKKQLYGENGTSHLRWMNKDGKNSRIHINKINEYIKLGWNLGKVGKNAPCSEERKRKISEKNKGKMYMSKQGKIISVRKEELEYWSSQGYQIGRKN